MTPHERANSLLTVHHGSCAVAMENDLVPVFREMERDGLLAITNQSGDFLNGIGMLHIQAKPVEQRISRKVMLHARDRHPLAMNQYRIEEIITDELARWKTPDTDEA